MAQSTYSFLDVTGSIHCDKVGDYIFTGKGVGSITISMAQERTAHDVAADGSVMVSKVAGNNGTITIEVQQTSPLNKWLTNWAHVLWDGPTSIWASTSLLIRCTATGTTHVCSGVSPQKEPDTPYQNQGQRVTWTLMCADIVKNRV